jgi:hypothetical protein
MGVKAYTLKMTYIWLPVLLVFVFGLYFLARICAIRLDTPYSLIVYFFYGFSAYSLWNLFKRGLPHAKAVVFYDKTVVRKELNRDILFHEIVGNSISYTDDKECQGLSEYVIYLSEEELNQIVEGGK